MVRRLIKEARRPAKLKIEKIFTDMGYEVAGQGETSSTISHCLARGLEHALTLMDVIV